jgi:hypothetical protein
MLAGFFRGTTAHTAGLIVLAGRIGRDS